ncbi:MAG: DUF222 domain-containing protein, partial [Micromonosporaceae bacterium]
MRSGGHPVADFVYAVNARASELTETPLWSLSDAEVTGLVEVAARVEAQLAAVRLRLVAEVAGRGLVARAAAPSTQAWLRGRLRLTPQAAKRDAVLAAALGSGLAETGRALAAGVISAAHAQVIAETVAELPEPAGGVGVDGPARLRRRAERQLIVWAGQFDPGQLRRLGRRICEVVDPDAADAAEAGKLAELEKRAYRRRELAFTPDGHGSVWVRGRLDTESAAIVRRALDPFAKPRPTDAGLPDQRSPGCRT